MLRRSITLYCPVCKSNLGTKERFPTIITRCEECEVTFLWKEGEKLPVPVMDSKALKVVKYCSKDGCVCHN